MRRYCKTLIWGLRARVVARIRSAICCVSVSFTRGTAYLPRMCAHGVLRNPPACDAVDGSHVVLLLMSVCVRGFLFAHPS